MNLGDPGARADGKGGPYSLLDTATPRQIQDGESPAATPFWAENPRLWSIVMVNEQPLPGVARVTGGVDMRIDSRKIAGTNGRHHTYLGNDAAKVNIELVMWMPEQLDSWAKFVPILKPRKPIRVELKTSPTQITSRNGKATSANSPRTGVLTPEGGSSTFVENLAVRIYHPALALYGIADVVVLHLGLVEPAGQDGVFKVEVHCEERVAPGAQQSGAQPGPTIYGSYGGKTARDLREKAKAQKPSVTSTGPN